MPDNDPLESLDNFPEGLHVDSLPASEVRRRGDRMRRRNTALATVGGVVAAAVFIGTPVALMSGNDKDTVDPAPAPPTPSVTEDGQPGWLTEIPAEFPVTEGMTDTGRPAEGGTDNFGLCDTSYPTSTGTADIQTWSWSDDGESSVQRTFQLWPDDAAARASLDRLEEAVQSCPQQPTQGGEEIIESKLGRLRDRRGRLADVRPADPRRRRAPQPAGHDRGDPRRQRRPGELELRLRRRRRGDRDRDGDPGRPVRDHPCRHVRVRGRPVLDHRGDPGPQLLVLGSWRERHRRDPGRLPARPRHGRDRGERRRGPRPGRRGRPRGRRLRHRRVGTERRRGAAGRPGDRHRVPRDPRARDLHQRRRARRLPDAGAGRRDRLPPPGGRVL